MAGHNKWSKIKRDKAVNDAKRGSVFTKIGNMIAIAAKKGTDPSTNPALAMAIEKAKSANMPNANVQRAIDRAADKNAAVLEEITYEGYGPDGIAFVIETATDNKNRTYPEVRTALMKNGGRIADPGSVLFQFDRKGVVRLKASGEDALMSALDCGAEDVLENDDELVAITEPKELIDTRQKLAKTKLEILDAELQYLAQNEIEVTDPEIARKVEKIIDVLEDLDDVSAVHTNAIIQVEV